MAVHDDDIGDLMLGFFTALGMPQLIVLTFVVVSGGAPLWLARLCYSIGLLR